MKIDPSLCRWTSMGGVDVQAILKSILVYLKTTQLLIMYRPLVMRMTLETKQLRIDTDGLDRIRICKVCQAGNLELFLHGMVTTHPPKIASFPDSAKSCQYLKSCHIRQEQEHMLGNLLACARMGYCESRRRKEVIREPPVNLMEWLQKHLGGVGGLFS